MMQQQIIISDDATLPDEIGKFQQTRLNDELKLISCIIAVIIFNLISFIIHAQLTYAIKCMRTALYWKFHHYVHIGTA